MNNHLITASSTHLHLLIISLETSTTKVTLIGLYLQAVATHPTPPLKIKAPRYVELHDVIENSFDSLTTF